jgi:hypothetical protein
MAGYFCEHVDVLALIAWILVFLNIDIKMLLTERV